MAAAVCAAVPRRCPRQRCGEGPSYGRPAEPDLAHTSEGRKHMLHRTTSSDGGCRTQMHLARQGTVSPEMRRVAEREPLPAEAVPDQVARGRMIIPANVHHSALDPMAIGLKASVKVNANIGSSPTTSSSEEEVAKLH